MVRIRIPSMQREARAVPCSSRKGSLFLSGRILGVSTVWIALVAIGGFCLMFLGNPPPLLLLLSGAQQHHRSDGSAITTVSDPLHRNNLFSPELTQALLLLGGGAVVSVSSPHTNETTPTISSTTTTTTTSAITITAATIAAMAATSTSTTPPAVVKFVKGNKQKYNASLRRYRDMPPWMDKFPMFPSADDIPAENRVCFVHVGKTAGSTLSCYLGFQYPACRDRIPLVPGNLPTYTTQLIHTHYDTCGREPMGWYLFTLRDPLARIQSWFAYERPTNRTSARQIKAKRPLYLDCNSTSLEEVGVALGRGNETECSRVAWRAVQGLHGYMSHNKHNFGHYYRMYEANRLKQMQQQQQQHPLEPRILIVRTEHLEQDWASVEATIAPSNNSSNNSSNTATVRFGRKNISRKKERDKHLSAMAQRNLCDALCEEIQVYKRLLQEGINLHRNDVQISMRELRTACPHEADTNVCPVRPDFGVQVY